MLYTPLGMWRSDGVAHQVIVVLSPPARNSETQRVFVYDPNHTCKRSITEGFEELMETFVTEMRDASPGITTDSRCDPQYSDDFGDLQNFYACVELTTPCQ